MTNELKLAITRLKDSVAYKDAVARYGHLRSLRFNPRGFINFLVALLAWSPIWGVAILLQDHAGAGWVAVAAFCFVLTTTIALSESDRWTNYVHSGRPDKVKQEIQEVREQIARVEQPISDMLETRLEYHFSNLYRKRSGTAQFEESMKEFVCLLDEADSLVASKPSSYYTFRNYLYERGQRDARREPLSAGREQPVSAGGQRVSAESERTTPRAAPQKRPEPPQKLYRTARKVDWATVSEQRRLTGMLGEEIAVLLEQDYLKAVGREDLAYRVQHVSKEQGDGLGYDVLSFFKDGREKYIEVKSTTGLLAAPFYVSYNELQFMREHSDDAFIYRVSTAGEPQVKITISAEFLADNQFFAVQYLVKSR